MTNVGTVVREFEHLEGADVFEEVASLTEPVVLKGLVSGWPIVQKSQISDREVDHYLRHFDGGVPVQAFTGDAEIGGRIFYDENLSKTNFDQVQTSLLWVLDQIHKHENDSAPPTFYMGSTAVDYCLPGLSEQNSLDPRDLKATVRIWIGNRTTVAAHYDTLDNIACVCTGKRRFTLFPPGQLSNLYIGPIDFTPGGQSVSLVDFKQPDFDQFPRFANALEHAQTAELEAGDAIFIPSMWWHHVESSNKLNILLNYWWRRSPYYLGAPHDALMHAILSIRDLPIDQRKAWQGIFDHYIFAANDQTVGHIPADAQGILGVLDEDSARKIRALLRNNLNR